MSSLGYYPMLALGTAAAIVGYALLSRNPKRSGENLEYERRTQLTQGGRIIEGTVIDVQEIDESPTQRQMILLIYTYDVAGVSYEASQDVTHLRSSLTSIPAVSACTPRSSTTLTTRAIPSSYPKPGRACANLRFGPECTLSPANPSPLCSWRVSISV